MTGRRRHRERRAIVLEVFCEAHRRPELLLRPQLDERGITLTGNQSAATASVSYEGPQPGARFLFTPSCRLCDANPEWRYEKVLRLMQALEPGVYQVNQHEMDLMVSSPQHAMTYLQQKGC